MPPNLQQRYACWLDEEFGALMRDLITDDFLVVTEWYQRNQMEEVSSWFNRQMVVTGYEGAGSFNRWQNQIPGFTGRVDAGALIGIWMFYDIGDGAGEEYTAYFPGEDELGTPFEE